MPFEQGIKEHYIPADHRLFPLSNMEPTMSESSAPLLTIGQLEAKYPMYCKAMRLLLREGCSRKQIERTVCWDRLSILHNSLPRSYKSPEYLFLLFRREVEQQRLAATA